MASDRLPGKTVRHRLNRAGDRQANRALHVIALTRLRYHEPTRAYVARRTKENLSAPEITRCLKRYIARQLHRSSRPPYSRTPFSSQIDRTYEHPLLRPSP